MSILFFLLHFSLSGSSSVLLQRIRLRDQVHGTLPGCCQCHCLQETSRCRQAGLSPTTVPPHTLHYFFSHTHIFGCVKGGRETASLNRRAETMAAAVVGGNACQQPCTTTVVSPSFSLSSMIISHQEKWLSPHYFLPGRTRRKSIYHQVCRHSGSIFFRE